MIVESMETLTVNGSQTENSQSFRTIPKMINYLENLEET